MNQGAPSPKLLREAAALVYVSDLEALELSSGDAHHLGAVLRLSPGEVVAACDGAGSFRGCVVAGDTSERVSAPRTGYGRAKRRFGALTLVAHTDQATVARAVPELTVGFSVAKGDRTDWAVAKLSELGVDRIVPLICERTAPRWTAARTASQHERLRRIAREASMQARRVYLPEVTEIVALAEASSRLGGPIAVAEPGGACLSLATPTVLVGPEGGFTPGELAMGFPRVGLAETILRIETAAVVAGAILSGLRAGLVAAARGAGAPAVTHDRSE